MRRMGAGGVIGAVLVIGVALLILKWVLTTVAVLAVPFGVWWMHDRVTNRRKQRAAQQRTDAAQRRRAQIEALAAVDVAGGCGWCGSRLAHIDRHRRIVLPRDWHRAEIEHVLQREGITRPAAHGVR